MDCSHGHVLPRERVAQFGLARSGQFSYSKPLNQVVGLRKEA